MDARRSDDEQYDLCVTTLEATQLTDTLHGCV